MKNSTVGTTGNKPVETEVTKSEKQESRDFSRGEFKIYDYDNKSIEVELPDKPIARIHVVILSGDETGTITFTDGSKIDFDASCERHMSFFDGEYDVEGDMIPRWMAYVPRVARHEAKAYKRRDWFKKEMHK